MKQAWIGNIPYTIAEMNHLRAKVNPSTPEGLSEAIFARYEDEDLAEEVLKRMRMEQKLGAVLNG